MTELLPGDAKDEPGEVDDARLSAARRRLEQLAPGYAASVQRAAARLGLRAGGGGLRSALLSVEDAATIDVDVPVSARQAPARWVKLAVKGATAWYLRYVGQQVTVLGQAVVRLGCELADRSEDLEARVAAIEERLDRAEPSPDDAR